MFNAFELVYFRHHRSPPVLRSRSLWMTRLRRWAVTAWARKWLASVDLPCESRNIVATLPRYLLVASPLGFQKPAI